MKLSNCVQTQNSCPKRSFSGFSVHWHRCKRWLCNAQSGVATASTGCVTKQLLIRLRSMLCYVTCQVIGVRLWNMLRYVTWFMTGRTIVCHGIIIQWEQMFLCFYSSCIFCTLIFVVWFRIGHRDLNFESLLTVSFDVRNELSAEWQIH